MADDPIKPYKRNDGKPLEPKSDNPSLNSELWAESQIESQVSPEDYPERIKEQRALSDPRNERKDAAKKS